MKKGLLHWEPNSIFKGSRADQPSQKPKVLSLLGGPVFSSIVRKNSGAMNGRSTVSYLVRAPRVLFFMFILIGLEAKGPLAFQVGDVGSLPLYGGTFARSYSVSKNGEGWNCEFQKTPRAEGGDKVPQRARGSNKTHSRSNA